MLKFYNHEKNIRSILEKADTNFVPLKNYKIINHFNKKLESDYLITWIEKEYWEEIKFIREPSKICYITNKNKSYEGFFDKILHHKCALVENYVIDDFRYIIIRPPRHFSCPKYDFKSGGTILLHYGGGYGDFFNSLRYIKLYPNCDFVAEVNVSLKRLIQKSNLFKKIIIKGDSVNTDFHLPIDSLVQRHGFKGSKIPFLNIEKNEKVNGGIGFCFQGNRVKYTIRRSFDPFVLEEFKNYNLYNLQKEIRDLPFAINLPINDWFDTAQIIQGCDLIVCPPTSITHLAGALGKKIITVFQDSYMNLENSYFNEKSSDFYPMIDKIHYINLKNYLKNYVKNKFR